MVKTINQEYSEEQWREELEHPKRCLLCSLIGNFYLNLRCGNVGVNCLGVCLPCPDCGTVGFYAARYEPNENIKYRMCKFCGFRQEVGGIPHHCNMFVHENCHLLQGISLACEVLKYDWNTGNAHTHFCGTEMTKTLRPTENQQHSQHILKEQIEKL